MMIFSLIVAIFVPIFLFSSSSYILCIDGGGSKTILQVLDQRGDLISLVHKGFATQAVETIGSNINTAGKEGVRACLKSIFEEVKIENGSMDLKSILSQSFVVAGMAGAGLIENKESLIELFAECGMERERILVMTDAELALQLIDKKGIVLISGTGSVCFGKKEEELFRVGGLGSILGDEGSGYQIGLQAIKAVIAHEYGWGAPTSMQEDLKQLFYVSDLKSLIPQITLGKMPPTKIASAAPIVIRHAMEGDSVAKEIVSSAAKQLGGLLSLQLKISGLSDCEVYLLGGIFKSPYAEAMIREMIGSIENVGKKKLCLLNRSYENMAVSYAIKFLIPVQML
jgi:N-acetylglucosamine kinase-like BadF-type ATPase